MGNHCIGNIGNCHGFPKKLQWSIVLPELGGGGDELLQYIGFEMGSLIHNPFKPKQKNRTYGDFAPLTSKRPSLMWVQIPQFNLVLLSGIGLPVNAGNQLGGKKGDVPLTQWYDDTSSEYHNWPSC